VAGQRRAAAVTGGAVAGGTALAVVFGVVFAGAAPQADAGPADLATATSDSAGQQDDGPTVPSFPTDVAAPTTAPPAPSSAPADPRPRRLTPPSQAPQAAAPTTGRHHASTGAS
jgi:hypothetical protein